MKRLDVEILPEAEQEFREVSLWYFERSPIAADAFRSLVHWFIAAIDDLAEKAELWPVSDDGFRFHVLDRFPYTIWYELVEGVVNVIAGAHQHRRPRYWMSRT